MQGAGVDAHVPVLLGQVVAGLAIRPDGTYLDATFGRGGHSRAILRQLGATGRLIAFDRDPAAVEAGERLAASDRRLLMERQSFGGLHGYLLEQGLLGRIDGLLLDLGVSSPQLDDAGRGFGFRADGPLDMRMDPDSGFPAADWINSAAQADIARVLREFGEEPAARRIAQAICRRRESAPFLRTGDLADVIAAAMPGPRVPGRHPATLSFQAIRIFINGELDELRLALGAVRDALASGGRLCVISFHSLEDRIVKRFLRDASRVDPALARLPVVPPGARPFMRLPCRAQRADEAELAANPRARSAVLRVGERL
ncbi:MAG: 16S rRNA (cytosine(1402)-N(4))-methyltransferase RsmH [Chromatiales bacterium]|nr:16S rRNA (cytosine(1402)-N(4))-methyltransferase RsmH [Chromatiales bacterium]